MIGALLLYPLLLAGYAVGGLLVSAALIFLGSGLLRCIELSTQAIRGLR